MVKNRHTELGLTEAALIKMYETMLTARRVDERMWLLNRAGKIPFVVSCQGHEAAQVGATFALDHTKDYLLPYYRDIASVLAFGMTVKDLLLSAFARAEDPNSGGRQMPGHFGQRKNRIVTGSSPVTTQVPHAVGIALAGKMEQRNLVALVTFGEGSANQGDFHEGINFASVHKLPVIFMCENNGYAISTPIEKQFACKRLSDRAVGYGIEGVTVDGNDPLEVFRVVQEAVIRARQGEGPTLIEALTTRLTAHSSDDDESVYRSQQELEAIKKVDPLVTFANYLKENDVINDKKQTEINSTVMELVDNATQYAENAPFAKPEEALQYVYEQTEGG